MFVYVEIEVPPNTPELAPIETRIRLTSGMCREEWVMFPDGCYGLVHLQVWHHGWQVWPWTPGQSLHWNDYVFHVEDRYPLEAEPYEFVVKCWSLDDFYSHHVTFAVVVDPLPPPTEVEDLTAILAELGLGED